MHAYPHRCLEDTQSDYVELSNFNIKVTDRKMSRFCGTKEEHAKKSVNSDGNFFRVTFKSNDIYDATGFEAFYQFRKIEGTMMTAAFCALLSKIYCFIAIFFVGSQLLATEQPQMCAGRVDPRIGPVHLIAFTEFGGSLVGWVEVVFFCKYHLTFCFLVEREQVMFD